MVHLPPNINDVFASSCSLGRDLGRVVTEPRQSVEDEPPAWRKLCGHRFDPALCRLSILRFPPNLAAE